MARSIHHGKQNFKCRDCGRQFLQAPPNNIVDQSTQDWIDKLLLEKIFLVGIARVAGVSEPWLQSYVRACSQSRNQRRYWPQPTWRGSYELAFRSALLGGGSA
ncbi:MAG: hypothetical protein BRC37_12695 [Cyanobacteria bacterium QH_3_48_40]|nr:MAG: hypothetical protein BRC37_12695 [Cyanobacteria bacterium QH_3_48_40]